MIIAKSVSGIPVRLTTERWGHIVRRHPEVKDRKEDVIDALQSPDFIQRGDLDELLAVKADMDEKFLVVIYKEIGKEDGFVLTAYITRKPLERRETIWKR